MASLFEGRQLLDKTLAMPEFSNRELLKDYLRNYLAKDETREASGRLSEDALEHRTDEVWEFLEGMRSVSGERTRHLTRQDSARQEAAGGSNDQEWKLKDDNGQYRVLYKKGPEGTPLHALCLEGVVEGPAVMGLCVAWEAPLFKEWWPRSTVPPFRIVESKWLKRIQSGIDIPYVRFKVPWPFAPREIAIISFEMEHAESGCVIAMMKSIPEDPDLIDGSEGYVSSDVPPPQSNWVRMGVSGGYMLQQISATRCYIRTITLIDMKLDLVPAWLINFVSRQLAGSGFKLFQEAVTEAVENNKGHGVVHRQLLASGALYVRVQEALQIHLDLEEARRAAAAGKRGEAEEVEAGQFRKLGQQAQEEVDRQMANGEAAWAGSANGEPSLGAGAGGEDAYAGLRERDPEMYDAVLAIDRALAMLRARKAMPGRSLGGAPDPLRTNRGEERPSDPGRDLPAGGAGGQATAGGRLSPPGGGSARRAASANGGGVVQRQDPGPEAAEGPGGPARAPGGKAPGDTDGPGQSKGARRVREWVDVPSGFSGQAARIEGLRAMSGRQGQRLFAKSVSWGISTAEEEGGRTGGALNAAKTDSQAIAGSSASGGAGGEGRGGGTRSADLQVVGSTGRRKSFRQWLRRKVGGGGKGKGGGKK